MKKLLVFVTVLTVVVLAFAADRDFYLTGRVKESFAKTDLLNAFVVTFDAEGNPRDSLPTNQGLSYRAGVLDTVSDFYLYVPRVDSTYIFDVVCKGYKPQTVKFTVSNIGRRERGRDIGVIYMDRAPIALKEVTVTTSKIKFYNDGDTLVYNADAFQLAQGSMLDALIAQLPGVELNTDGQIKVNGEFVESLLLNGKEFFDGNNNLMLENIAAYTVKDIKVYDAPRPKDKIMGFEGDKVLTMNVRLKKEYNIGWLLNAQAGYGTRNRYLGRLFASWFNPTTRVSLVGNINDLNSNQTPGRNDTWTPDMLPDGTKTYATGGINYNYEHPERKSYAEGHVMFMQEINNSLQTTNRTNFLPGHDTYDYSFDRSHNRSVTVTLSHFLSVMASNRFAFGADINGSYMYGKTDASSLSGTFADNPGEMSAEILDAIYSDGSEELLESVLNRSKTQTDNWKRSYWLSVNPYIAYRLNKTNDNFFVRFGFDYLSAKEELWRDYDIRFGAVSSETVDRQRQVTDNSPDHDLKFNGSVAYRTSGDHYRLNATYSYKFTESVRDSYMYRLDRLNEMGVYGVLPPDYRDAFDPQNSFTSRTVTNSHGFNPNFMYFCNLGQNSLQINIKPEISLVHRNFYYWNNNRDSHLSLTNATVRLSGYADGMVQFDFNKKEENGRSRFRNSLRYSYSVTPTLPDLSDMVDIDFNADPLNIYVGNPDLKTAWRHRHLLRWQYNPHSHPTFFNILYFSYTHASNSLVRGFTYDTETGVRINRMYNVDGNHTWAATNELSWQFGTKKQFTLSSNTDGILATYNDMIGVDGAQPRKTTVRNNSLTQNVRFNWLVGKQTLGLRCDFTTRHTTSEQPGFNTINAHHINYGVSGTFLLPAGFSINTDFTCYTRRGYGSKFLDTTDAVWNLRLSYAPERNNHWLFMIDGFDLLHRLSNVNYAVTAAGRTVSYSNTIPRYIMFSVQYRLNIQPPKR